MFLQFNKLASITPFRPLGHPLCVDGSAVFSVNLWLSAQGICDYRKVTTRLCGRRKEIKKSPHTRTCGPACHSAAFAAACVVCCPSSRHAAARSDIAGSGG
ncbi:hypothetical protein EHZ64_10385 [Aeromonas enteropelogenes]|nr:hypothetical protein EHZ64_10385 [Aeromonas enteropelogenes]